MKDMYKDRERERMDQGSASHLLYDSLKRLGGLIEGGPGLKSPPLVEHPFRIGPHHPPGLVLVRPWTERGGGVQRSDWSAPLQNMLSGRL